MSSVHRSRIMVLLLGTLVGLLALELGIRAIGAFHQREVSPPAPADGSFRIVFLGNSHTFGAGVNPEETYSRVLGDFFHKEAPTVNVSVTEAGVLNGTTEKLRTKMRSLLPELRPQLVVVMGGEPNVWNRSGLAEYLRIVKGQGPGKTLRDFLSHSRLLRWLLSLSDQPLGEELPPEKERELLVYQALADFDVSPGTAVADEKGGAVMKALAQFVTEKEKNPPPEWRRAVFFLGLMEIRVGRDFRAGLAHLRTGLLAGNSGAYELEEIIDELEEGEFPGEFRQELRDLKALSERGEGELSRRLEEAANTHTFPPDPELARLVVEYFPYNSRLMYALAEAQQRRSGKSPALKIYQRLLQTNPLQNQFASVYETIEASTRSSEAPEVQELARRMKAELVSRFPTELARFDSSSGSDLEDWIRWDLGNLVREIHAAGARVVLQTYHYHGHRPGFRPAERVRAAIVGAARDSSVPLLETDVPFMKEVRAFRKSEAFFADQWLHPSVTGHRIIARIIYDSLSTSGHLPVELRKLPAQKIYRFSWE